MTDKPRPPFDFKATRISDHWCLASYSDAGDAWLAEHGVTETEALMIDANDMEGVLRAMQQAGLAIQLEMNARPQPSPGRFPTRAEAEQLEAMWKRPERGGQTSL